MNELTRQILGGLVVALVLSIIFWVDREHPIEEDPDDEPITFDEDEFD